MSRLLYIEASPMKTGSHSIDVANSFLQSYRTARPADEIDTIDVWDIDLPPFDATMVGAKFAVLRAHNATPEQQQQWNKAVALSRRFNAADKYLISTPMWNFNIPYRLKHFIDVVTLPGENWSWSRAEGYKSLLTGRKAVLIYSSAGAYTLAPGEANGDFQKPYLRHWLNFIGVVDVREINVAPTLSPAEALEITKSDARRESRDVAALF